VRAAALPGETIMLRIELMPVKSESEFHLENYCGFKARSKTPFLTQRQWRVARHPGIILQEETRSRASI
jgi:hypothetical protein